MRAEPMSDPTTAIEGGDPWPRRYTPPEIDVITQCLCPHKFSPRDIDRLQKAVEGYQWATLGEGGHFPGSTNKGRRTQLKNIIELCKREAPDEEIQTALDELDALTAQKLFKSFKNLSKELGPVKPT